MIIFVKLLLAHLIGDFILQPNRWVADKETHGLRSRYFFLHLFVHAFLAALVIFETRFAIYALGLAFLHGAIDFLKIRFQKKKTMRRWFIIDQLLHLVSLALIAFLYSGEMRPFAIDIRFWPVATAILLMTTPGSIIIKNIISAWTPYNNDTREDLENAGKYIGILERLFVFGFIMTGHFEAIGFLLAAKSIFRFGDLTQSKDRKLTEYVLIGTLLSFGLAIASGLLTDFVLTLISEGFFY